MLRNLKRDTENILLKYATGFKENDSPLVLRRFGLHIVQFDHTRCKSDDENINYISHLSLSTLLSTASKGS